jgi:hypothetical protein
MWSLLVTFALAADYNLSEQINESERSESEISAQVSASSPRERLDTSDLTVRAPANVKKRHRLEGDVESVIAPLTAEYFQAPDQAHKSLGFEAEEQLGAEVSIEVKRKK